MVTIFWILDTEFSIVMKQPLNFDVISKFVYTEKGQKFVPGQCRRMLEKVVVLSCVSASGSSLAHSFLYKPLSGKIPKYVTNGAEESTMFWGQKSAWMSKDICLKWFEEQFLKFAPAEQPLLLLFGEWFKGACHHMSCTPLIRFSKYTTVRFLVVPFFIFQLL